MDNLEPVLLLTTIQNSDECGRCVIGVYLQLQGPSAGFTQGLTQLFGQGIAACPTHSVLFRSPISEVGGILICWTSLTQSLTQSLHPICNTGMRHLVGMVPCAPGPSCPIQSEGPILSEPLPVYSLPHFAHKLVCCLVVWHATTSSDILAQS